MTGAADTAAALRLRVWQQICRHLDGIAVGTTVAALAKAGVLAMLGRENGPLDIDLLADRHRSPRGYFHLAMRLLDEQGWVRREHGTVSLTEGGRDWLPHAGRYANAAEGLAVAQDLFTALVRDTAFDERRFRAFCATAAETGIAPDRVHHHLWAVLAAAAASGLRRSGRFAGREPVVLAAIEVLKQHEWVDRSGTLTDAGRLALDWSAQYDHSISYFPTFAAVGGMLFPSANDRPSSPGFDSHLDRRLDIDFSGNVFSQTCRDRFFELALPLFDAEPLASQPKAIVDTGAGDGSLLRELYVAIRDRTRRGSALAEHKLTMVGVEPSPIAREVIEHAMAAIGAPAIVVDGDIAEPDAIARRVAPFGVDFAAALHVSKSVIHDRSYRAAGPGEVAGSGSPWPPCDAVFVAEDGGLIPAAALQADLVRHFRDWRPWIGRHGLIVIEAHTVPARLITAHEGRNVMTSLDASHGYSHQYLVERPTYLRAAAEAGLVSSGSRALAAEMLGTPIITIEHWRPVPPGPRTA